MKIKVEQCHIDNGVREDCENCAFALALKEHFKQVNVSDSSSIDCDKVCYIANAELDYFIADFDEGKPVEPTEFEIHEQEPDGEFDRDF